MRWDRGPNTCSVERLAALGVLWGDDSRESSEEVIAAIQAKGMAAEAVVGGGGKKHGCIWNMCWSWGRSVWLMSRGWRLRDIEGMLRFD